MHNLPERPTVIDIRAKGLSRLATLAPPAMVLYVATMSDFAWAVGETPTPALGLSTQVYTASAKALTMLFVTAVVLESAFAVIFNWRVFLAYFDTKGVKTIVMIVISTIVVFYFKLDIFASLLAAFTMPETSTDTTVVAASLAKQVDSISDGVSKFITALVLAGGSSGIHNLMYALGFRSDRDAETTTKPAQNQAWVSVSVTCKSVDGPVQIGVSKVDTLPDGAVATALAGSVKFRRPKLEELLLRNLNRFPQNGGYVVETDKIYMVQAVADKRGEPGTQVETPPRYYRFSPGAIVDLDIVF